MNPFAITIHLIILIGFILGILWLFRSTEMADDALQGVLLTGIGLLFSKISTIIDYLYGSSEGSRFKDDFLMQPASEKEDKDG